MPQELRRRISAAIYGWDCPLLTFIYPGFDCGSYDRGFQDSPSHISAAHGHCIAQLLRLALRSARKANGMTSHVTNNHLHVIRPNKVKEALASLESTKKHLPSLDAMSTAWSSLPRCRSNLGNRDALCSCTAMQQLPRCCTTRSTCNLSLTGGSLLPEQLFSFIWPWVKIPYCQ